MMTDESARVRSPSWKAGILPSGLILLNERGAPNGMSLFVLERNSLFGKRDESFSNEW